MLFNGAIFFCSSLSLLASISISPLGSEGGKKHGKRIERSYFTGITVRWLRTFWIWQVLKAFFPIKGGFCEFLKESWGHWKHSTAYSEAQEIGFLLVFWPHSTPAFCISTHGLETLSSTVSTLSRIGHVSKIISLHIYHHGTLAGTVVQEAQLSLSSHSILYFLYYRTCDTSLSLLFVTSY